MKILFVRHAIAADPPDFRDASDLARPLTAEGRRKARRVFQALARFYDPPDLIVSSDATRARQTADWSIIANAWPWWGMSRIYRGWWRVPWRTGC